MEPEVSTPTDINILGEYNLAGEFWQVKPLLDKLGIRVHCCITGDARYAEVASAHRAKVNMMVCSAALINLARKMEERWGIPYFEGSFYGVSDTSDALRNIAGLLVRQGAPHDLIGRTEALIAAGRGSRLGAPQALSRAPQGQARAALYRRREILVGRLRLDGGRHRDRRHVAAQGDARRQAAHQGAARRRSACAGKHGAARHVRLPQGGQGRHHAVGRTHPVHRPEGPHALARHQPGAPRSLRRL